MVRRPYCICRNFSLFIFFIYSLFFSQNDGSFAPLNMPQKSPNFACKPDLVKNFIFHGLHSWVWQNASVAPPTNFQKALAIGVSLSQAHEIWYTHVACQDAQKSLWQPWSKLNRKSAILISLVNFGFFFGYIQGVYLNELVLGTFTDRLETW